VLLLAIDTSTTAITVALHDGAGTVAEATTLDARGHAEHLAPGVERVLASARAAPADLTDVACGLGPGPFTGLRVGVVTARTLALVTGARLHGLCSLDALAYQARTDGRLLVATDARRKEVYWAVYASGGTGIPERLDGPHVGKPADLPPEVAVLPAVGRGPVLYPSAFERPLNGPLDVSAAALADLVARRITVGDPVGEHEPYYLRRPDAAPSVTTKSALG
jgi:tRNA threonylcarbamoyl adenosine modification protein YeaZ